jgi:hypothetical protein
MPDWPRAMLVELARGTVGSDSVDASLRRRRRRPGLRALFTESESERRGDSGIDTDVDVDESDDVERSARSSDAAGQMTAAYSPANWSPSELDDRRRRRRVVVVDVDDDDEDDEDDQSPTSSVDSSLLSARRRRERRGRRGGAHRTQEATARTRNASTVLLRERLELHLQLQLLRTSPRPRARQSAAALAVVPAAAAPPDAPRCSWRCR